MVSDMPEYQERTANNISTIRARIQKMIDIDGHRIDRLAAPWVFGNEVLSYILDLSPESLKKIRLHTEFFTGEAVSQLLFTIPSADPARYAEAVRYKFYTGDLPEWLHIGEPPLPPPIAVGTNFKGRLVNPDLARVQAYLGNLARAGLFDDRGDQRTVFLEIGPGYGGIEHHLLTLMPNKVTCIMIDLPLMLVISSAYIATNNPGAKIYIYDPEDPRPVTSDDVAKYDVIMIPHYRLDLLTGIDKIDFAMNVCSFQEMELCEVRSYLEFIAERLTHTAMVHANEYPDGRTLNDLFAEYFTLHPSREAYSQLLPPGSNGPFLHFLTRNGYRWRIRRVGLTPGNTDQVRH